MNLEKMLHAEEEAEEFLKRAKIFRERISNYVHPDILWIGGCKESSAVRRQSLELTRALADLRKPG